MAIITEAIHSAIDLIASIVAYFSVRQAETPADSSHRYGHEKFENVAAGVEGMLILVGSGVIVYTAVNHLVEGTEIESIGFGIAVVGFATVVNLVVSHYLYRRAAATDSAALAGDAAHLRTDAYTSLGVLVGLAPRPITGETWIDPVVALLIAVAIVYTGLRVVAGSWRVLVDEALPDDETAAIRDGDRVLRRARRGRLPRAAHPPRGLAPLRRRPRPVPLRHHARGRARDRPRAPGHDPRAVAAAPTCSSTSSPRTASGRARRSARARERGSTFAQRRLIAAEIATASSTPAYPR